MQTLNDFEISAVSGGDNSTMGPYDGNVKSGTPCANSMLFWGGVGSGIGSLFGGAIGFFGGAAGGGWLATKLEVCSK